MADQILEHFWDKVQVDSVTGCWNWMAGKYSDGYGQFYNGTKGMRAHNFAYEINKGKIPEGLVLDHLCRNKICVNPDHLEAVTSGENVLRGQGITANKAKQTHCIHGHPLSGDNLHINRDGERVCKTCANNRSRAWKLKRSLKI